MTATADLVVVGGGVLGVAVALHARRTHPDWRVALLDQTAPGAGATGRSLAVVAPTGENSAIRGLAARAVEIYRSTELHDCVRPRSALVVVPEHAEPMLKEQTTSTVRRADASDVQRLRASAPGVQLRPGDAVFAVDDGFLQVDTATLAELPADAGVTVAHDTRITACREADGQWELLAADNACWRTPRVVLAVGPWEPPDITAAEGPWVPPRTRVKRVASLHVPAYKGEPDDPLVAFPADNLLLVPGEDGLRVSFLHPHWRSGPLAHGAHEAPDFTADDLAAGRAALAVRAPTLAEQAVGGQVFWDTYPEDPLAFVSGPAAGSLRWLNGGAGRGVRLAPALAEAALAVAERPRPDAADLSPATPVA
ncbi:FAD-dependent oxidoreductase [Yinghuangia seranimata]|uniref:FAD-dependent oxidoreductase n=1 Tax=Yinghuangia seranimata TaxID=408067 RepID=UPI00248BAC5F|nr:FAD-dependent oxidoreductase [Yinghuangia seranimata]MDI2128355.1 FAD-dependent oxidoreductase [Yinghuangia seranimata]